ncbi:GM11555 [Drosophila sechellia]|uniref:GM11555 n=3 Tax=Drosophila sechellia TaxID=7238 RepID=B4IGF1_DROSE|nr:GM11555 [Drosophila sechellia]
MRLAILWLFSGLLPGIQDGMWASVRAQQTGRDVLLSRMGNPQNELNTRRLANASSYLTRNYIANRINTLVVRENCVECRYEPTDRQRQLVDQILASLAPDLSVLLHKGTAEETTSEYTLFVVNDHTAFT